MQVTDIFAKITPTTLTEKSRSTTWSDEVHNDPALPHEKGVHTTTKPDDTQRIGADNIDGDAQRGVQRMQALATVWTRSNLIAAYTFIWLIYSVVSLEEVIVRALTPYVTSDFSLHSLTAATNIMAYIIGGLTKIPLAKILDTWGRPQGMALCLVIWVVGFVMMAACNNVETYAAAQVFSAVGSQGVSYCMTVFVSDTSALRNRGLMLAFATSPYIFTTFAGGPASESVLSGDGPGWRWGFGIFTIIIPVVVTPLVLVFWYNQHKAEKKGLISATRGSVTFAALKKYAVEVDLFGCLLLASGMALFLLPFSLWSYQRNGWESPMIIGMITSGAILLILFVLWEKYLAPKTFIPFELLADRTVLGGSFMFIFNFAGSSIATPYFYSMLQVVWDLNVTQASYISSIFRVGQCLFSIFVGIAIRWSGGFKWLAMYVGMPLNLLGVGLKIYARQPDKSIGIIAVSEIFTAFAGGCLVICGELAMMAPSDHQHVAVILAILNLVSSIGSAIGNTIATTIWTREFHNKLVQYTPEGTDVAAIYASLRTQLSYEVGSPVRDGINTAYGETQRLLVITALCFLAVAYGFILIWKDLNVKIMKQVKGRVV